ncbi:hypothetical protein DPX16_10098 [Anabarilius grahami]|uniref:Uncharacterized protein n=1 Tax=Anabarilius grahami TaxID=495550 RepID=A0A3N0XWX0_ANAGA|nr:hypothetical protein DPX16_10098 [Anabarilius grahami]
MEFKKYDRWTDDEVQALLSIYAEDKIQQELEIRAQSYVTGLISRPAVAAGAGGVVKSEPVQVRKRAFVPPPSPCSLGNTHTLESHETISFSLLQRAGQHSHTGPMNNRLI